MYKNILQQRQDIIERIAAITAALNSVGDGAVSSNSPKTLKRLRRLMTGEVSKATAKVGG